MPLPLLSSHYTHKYSAETKTQAIQMRKEGRTYAEILKVILVAKSTLSLWLRDVGMAKKQHQHITEKRKAGQRKGALSRHTTAVNTRNDIYKMSASQIGRLSEREVWLLAAALYWAEGSKEKIRRSGSSLAFSNTDPRMIRLFMFFLMYIQDISPSSIKYDICIHINHVYRINKVRQYWSKELRISLDRLQSVRYKKHNPKTNRTNVGVLYNGLIQVRVMQSSATVRQFEGWVRGIDSYIEKMIQI